ncbi:DUF2268 domain-containing putative Zn-dependent protease [Lysinibacillus sp. FSL H8-0500]|uniref:DUF2268 domain-containing protein n=1 Tax=Lysinibacillus sp. FSL H8-0500 TaxID=2921393 RepID=UPI0031014B2C
MTVQPTDIWLHNFVIQQQANGLANGEVLQRTLLCRHLLEIFYNGSLEEIQFELLQQGLFHSDETINIQNLQEQNSWEVVQKEYIKLKETWNGPSIPIYIFPLTTKQTMTNKNGIAYPNALFLLIDKLERQELQALFAHEYHHICRMHYLNKSLQDMTLLDSLILEGLAESAVKELYGDQWLAPWLNNYTFDHMLALWKKDFLANIHLEGLENHVEFLYGGRLPPWGGYCIGYAIVQSYIKNHSSQNLLITPSQSILVGSEFPL